MKFNSSLNHTSQKFLLVSSISVPTFALTSEAVFVAILSKLPSRVPWP